jgi:hypothetical protein
LILLPDPEDNISEEAIKAVVMALEPMKTRYERLRDACAKCDAVFTMAKAPEMPTHFYVIKNRFSRPAVPLVFDSICGLLKDAEQSSSYVDETHNAHRGSVLHGAAGLGRSATAQDAPRKV